MQGIHHLPVVSLPGSHPKSVLEGSQIEQGQNRLFKLFLISVHYHRLTDREGLETESLNLNPQQTSSYSLASVQSRACAVGRIVRSMACLGESADHKAQNQTQADPTQSHTV
jgi:hypothetical protein